MGDGCKGKSEDDDGPGQEMQERVVSASIEDKEVRISSTCGIEEEL